MHHHEFTIDGFRIEYGKAEVIYLKPFMPYVRRVGFGTSTVRHTLYEDADRV